MIEVVKAIAMLCSINMGTGIDNKYYSKELLEEQYACQKSLARCVIERSGMDRADTLLTCVRDK